MSSDLANQECIPCKGGIPPMDANQTAELVEELHDDWELIDNHHLHREWDFPDFATALDFVNRVGELAEQEGHHPNIEFTWGQVTIEIYTHKIDGLALADFVLAAKIDEIELPE